MQLKPGAPASRIESLSTVSRLNSTYSGRGYLDARTTAEPVKDAAAHTVAYTGNNRGAMAPLADLNGIISSDTTMNIQESHLALEHIFCMVVERFFFGEDFGREPQQLAE